MSTLQPLNITKLIKTANKDVQQFLAQYRSKEIKLKRPYNIRFDLNDTVFGNIGNNLHNTYVKTEIMDLNNQWHNIGYMDTNAVELIQNFHPFTLQERGGTEEKPNFGLKVFVYSKPTVQTEASIMPTQQPVTNTNKIYAK